MDRYLECLVDVIRFETTNTNCARTAVTKGVHDLNQDVNIMQTCIVSQVFAFSFHQ